MSHPWGPVEREDWIDAPAGLGRLEGGHVATTPGFVAAGVACGMKPSGGLDLGVLRSIPPAVSGIVDTASALPAAPVVRNRTLPAGRIGAVVVNSARANAATGEAGLRDAHEMGRRAAAAMGLDVERVAVCSTGTIGETLPVEELIGPGIDRAVAELDPAGGPRFGMAIQTTDRTTKGGAFRLELAGEMVTIGAAAKGAGMISPNMATMLAYLTTDAAIDLDELGHITAAAARRSFNRISVDGQMSPSDTLLIMANGRGAPLAGDDRDRLARAIEAICRWLAIQMVKDGEGAEHAVRTVVRGARDAGEAAAVARAIGNSPLIKTAVFGRDPNWGRISQAVGQALAGSDGPHHEPRVGVDGVSFDDPAAAAAVMARAEYDLEIDLGRGRASDHLWLADLGHAYVTLNAEYHT